ncbi:hypothetical protein IAR50_002779 [Cryptococcus sp. DSM 104548]
MDDDSQVTPPEIRQSIYRKGVVELHNKIGVDYVAWMEDTAASVFETFTEIDTTIYPETFGPRDENPLIRFNEWLTNLPRPAYDPYKYYESSAEAEGAKQRMKDPFISGVMKRHKEARSSGPAQVLSKPVEDPWPKYLQPQEVLMTAKMMRETLTIGDGDDGLPKVYGALGQEGTLQLLSILRNPQIKPRRANADEVLKLSLGWSNEELKMASENAKEVKSKMKAHSETISGSVSENPIWGRWEEEGKSLLDIIPVPFSPPLFPLKEAVADLPQLPKTFQDLEGVVEDTSRSGSRLPVGRGMVRRGLGPVWATDNDSEEFVEKAMSSKNLDDFDGVPFAPLTPNSVNKHSRVQPIPARAPVLPPSPPPTHDKSKRMPWEDDPRVEPPLMPARFDLPSADSEHINQLFSPVRNSSPPLPLITQEDGSDIAAPSVSGVEEQAYDPRVWPMNKIFRDILSSTELGSHKEREGYTEVEEMAFAHAASEELDVSKTNHMRVPTVSEEAYKDPRNNLPASYSGLADNFTGGIETEKMLFVKYPGVNTALASELDWNPYPSNHHSSIRHDQAARVSALPDPPASRIRQQSSDRIPDPVLNPADAAIRSVVERPAHKMTPAKPRWKTIQDAEREQGLKSSTKAASTSSLPSETTTLPAASTPSATAKRRTKKRKKGQMTPDVAADILGGDELLDEEVVKIMLTPKNKKKAVGNMTRERKAATGLKAPLNPSLDDILGSMTPPHAQKTKGARIDHSTDYSAATLTRAAATDPSTLSGFLRLQNLGHLAEQEPEVVYRPAAGQELPAIYEEDEEVESVDWRVNPEILNPAWYSRASQRDVQPYTDPVSVFAKVDLFQNRHLVKALESQNFYLFDSTDLQGADLVLSPSTALMFRSLQSLPDTHVQLLEQLKETATFYHHVVLVFETISFAAAEGHGDARKNISSLGVEILHALGSLKRGRKAAWQGNLNIIGQVEFVFACEGANEVVKGVMAMLESDETALRDRMGEEEYQYYGGREWMQYEPIPEHEATMIDTFGINTYSARYAAARHGGAKRLAYEMLAEERLLLLGPIWGEDVVMRFNAVFQNMTVQGE